jgi:uncharacterized membrane protein SirB2
VPPGNKAKHLLMFNSHRLTYTEAVDILSREHEKHRKFEFEPKVSDDMYFFVGMMVILIVHMQIKD